jgi:hypothetical protein
MLNDMTRIGRSGATGSTRAAHDVPAAEAAMAAEGRCGSG